MKPQKLIGKTISKTGKTDSKTSPKSCIKLAERTPIYRVQKTNCWAQFSCQNGLSIDRSVDWTTVIFLTVGVTGGPLGRLPPGHIEETSLSVDRSVDRHPTKS